MPFAQFRAMYRLFDFECDSCGTRAEALVSVPAGESPPKSIEADCWMCECVTGHSRIMPLVARYLGEKVFNPAVYGGRFDTMGHQALPSLPDVPGWSEAERQAETALRDLPDNHTLDQRREALRSVEFPGADAYMELAAKPETKEIKRERKRIAEQNAQKKQRAAAIRRGDNVNMRTDRCAGDPKVTA